jgi:hypothetical protein
LVSIDDDILPGPTDGDCDIPIEPTTGRANRGFEPGELISVRIVTGETLTPIGEHCQSLTNDRIIDRLARHCESLACAHERLTTHTIPVDGVKYNYSDLRFVINYFWL